MFMRLGNMFYDFETLSNPSIKGAHMIELKGTASKKKMCVTNEKKISKNITLK